MQVDLPALLPQLRGRLRAEAPLAEQTWFRVGGPAEWLFKPDDAEDLAYFMANKPDDLPVTILGAASNVIIRDGGIDGVVIRLGRGFAGLALEGDLVVAGAANLDVNVAEFACQHGRSGLEFLSGIPGAIGGAVAMNAGAYGAEIVEMLVDAQMVMADGAIQTMSAEEIGFGYRCSGLPRGAIVTSVRLRTIADDSALIAARMQAIARARADSQPVRARTGGSTFRNPTPHMSDQQTERKAWELIDAAGCRGMMVGGAQVSEKHCNFLINTGGATAAELEQLGQNVRSQVYHHCGIDLQWEIKIIGKAA